MAHRLCCYIFSRCTCSELFWIHVIKEQGGVRWTVVKDVYRLTVRIQTQNLCASWPIVYINSSQREAEEILSPTRALYQVTNPVHWCSTPLWNPINQSQMMFNRYRANRRWYCAHILIPVDQTFTGID